VENNGAGSGRRDELSINEREIYDVVIVCIIPSVKKTGDLAKGYGQALKVENLTCELVRF